MPFAERMSCWAVTPPGIELLLAAEMRTAGLIPGDVEPGGVAFSATPAKLADALLWLRTANRVTVRIAEFHAAAFSELERHAAQVPWSDVLAPGVAVHFRVTSKKSRLYHEDAIAERLERAAQSAVPGIRAVRAPSHAEVLEADVTRLPEVQRIVVRVFRDAFTVSADASGAPLYLRGWRQAVGKAPLRETLAAALLAAARWPGDAPLADPFCGSGTIPIEAALLARRMAPGRARRFAVEAWPAIDSGAFAAARARAAARELPNVAVSIAGSDRDAGAIAGAVTNAERAGVSGDITFATASISDLPPLGGTGWIVTNPPYGVRVGDRYRLRDLYAAFGSVVRDRRPGWHLVMLSADRMLDAQIAMTFAEILQTTNGGIRVRALEH